MSWFCASKQQPMLSARFVLLTVNDLHRLQAQHCVQHYHSCTTSIVLLARTAIAVLIYPDDFNHNACWMQLLIYCCFLLYCTPCTQSTVVLVALHENGALRSKEF